MGRTLPTLTQQLNETEAALARFRRTLRKSDQYIFDGLFASARQHTAALSQTEVQLPFEAALLEQAKEIAILRQKLEALESSTHRLTG